MPYTTFYALSPRSVERYLKEVRATLEGDKERMWPSLYRSFEAFHPPSLLTTTSFSSDRPLTQVSYHANSQWNDITLEERPKMDEPRMQWLLRQIVLGTAEYVFKGRDDRFNSVFCIWLPDQKPFRNKEEEAHFDWWCSELFYSRAPMPPDMPFLETPDAHRAYWPPETVQQAAEQERRTSFLSTMAGRLQNEEYGTLVATELLRIARFIDLCEADGLAIYYYEERT